MASTSVTRWLSSLFNIRPFTTMKIWAQASTFAKVSLKFRQMLQKRSKNFLKKLPKWCNLVTLVSTNGVWLQLVRKNIIWVPLIMLKCFLVIFRIHNLVWVVVMMIYWSACEYILPWQSRFESSFFIGV